MIKLYLKEVNGRTLIEDGQGAPVGVSHATIRAAASGSITPTLRRALRAALGEDVVFEDRRAQAPTKSRSGKHVAPRRKISDSAEEFVLQDNVAAKDGESWADWARAVLRQAARDKTL